MHKEIVINTPSLSLPETRFAFGVLTTAVLRSTSDERGHDERGQCGVIEPELCLILGESAAP